MLYEIATLDIRVGTAPDALNGVEAFLKDGSAKGTLLGCWTSEIGTLNQIYVLRGYADEATLRTERSRATSTTSPFNCGDKLEGLTFDTYALFPFLPPIAPAKHGKIYEIRTYILKHGGLPHTLAAWKAAVPARVVVSPLVAALYTLDGPQRITHIWPYPSIEARMSTRSDCIAKGIWPPKGGLEWLTSNMRSTIVLPSAFSPLS